MPIIKNKDDLSMNIVDIMKEVVRAGNGEIADIDSTLREEWGLITHSPDLLDLVGINGIILECMNDENLICIIHGDGAFVIEQKQNEAELPFIEIMKQLNLHAEIIRSMRAITGKKPKDLDLTSQSDIQLVKEDKYGPN